MKKMKLLNKYIIKEFITHVAKTNNKIVPDKYIKISYNMLYSGNLHYFSRSTIVNNLHDYIINYLDNSNYKDLLEINNLKSLHIHLKITTVINHGNIRRNKKGDLVWKKANSNYIPNWDIENLANLWLKTINDTLVANNNIPDDNIKYITGCSYEFIECSDISDRNIEILIYGKPINKN